MLQNILKSNGVQVLDKEQQESLKGGDTCHVLIEGSAGTRRYVVNGVEDGWLQATTAASNLYSQAGSVSRIRYDCGFDDFTASWW